MFKNYLRTALNNLLRHKVYTFINLSGLAVGMAATILILVFVQDELSFDQFHKNKDSIYRVHLYWKNNNSFNNANLIGPYRLGPALETAYEAEIESVVRIASNPSSTVFKYGDKVFDERNIASVDEGMLNAFDFEFVHGDPQTALSVPNTVVLNEVVAQRLFGDENPIGKDVLVDDQYTMKVTGVMKDLPQNSHFHFNGFTSMKTMEPVFSDRQKNEWGEGSVVSYIHFKEGVNVEAFQSNISNFIKDHIGEEANEYLKIKLMPLTDIHLHSHTTHEYEANGNFTYVVIFSFIAFFIILIACINYMNLSTARSAERAKEVGLRKVIGAHRSQIAIQFLGESLLMSMLSLALAVFLAEFSLPSFNQIAGKSLEINFISNDFLLVSFLTLAVVVGIVSGSYPALFLSSFKPVKVLKGNKGTDSSGALGLRKVLVVIQFSLSIFLIIGTLVINQQISFLHHKDLGIEVDQVISVPMVGNYETVKNQLLDIPNVTHVTATNKRMTGQLSSFIPYTVEGAALNEEGEPRFGITTLTMDHDFFDTYQVEVLEGRAFSREVTSDLNEGFIFNEAAIKIMELEDPIGKSVDGLIFDLEIMDFKEKKGKIIGVVEDFHFESLYEEIRPVAFQLSEDWLGWMSIKIKADDIPNTITEIENIYKEHAGDQTFTFSFIDDYIDQLYQQEERFLTVFSIFSILAIFIACLGIFGLAAFTAERRTKEIGIRKVLGSSATQIIIMITTDFVKLVAIASLVGYPIAYFAMQEWLTDFTYHVDLGIGAFILATVLALFIAIVSVSSLAIKASLVNPVKALRQDY